ncbi:MAG: urease accessory protein [Alphaproteobacteria bacterium]|nr:urease accessory protein [Alphaproteobacteria bacterium]
MSQLLRAWSARLVLPLLLALSGGAAEAHPGHGQSFAAGLVHPLTGVDHMLAMLMVGLWARLCFGRHWWAGGLAFLGFMLAGFAWGCSSAGLALAEALILASLFGLGGALLFGLRPPMIAALAVIALFATAHGFAHGAELAGGGRAAFAGGFLLSTIALQAAGAALAHIRAPQCLARAIGAVAIVSGTVLIAAS